MHDVAQIGSILGQLSESGVLRVGTRVRIVKNELGGSATQQELKGWGSQWNEQGNWGLNPHPPSIRTLVGTYIAYNKKL